jgi:hypothetical protein
MAQDADTTRVERPDLRAELLAMREADQAVRAKLIELIKTSGGQPDMTAFMPLKAKVDSVDAANVERVVAIVDARDAWPGAQLVGRDGSEAAFLIIQHASLDVQQRMLPLVKAAYEAGDLSGQSYALLLDRVLVGQGEPQVYGTQASIQNGTLVVPAIADSAQVDERRAALDLPPLETYLDMMREMYQGETQTPE